MSLLLAEQSVRHQNTKPEATTRQPLPQFRVRQRILVEVPVEALTGR